MIWVHESRVAANIERGYTVVDQNPTNDWVGLVKEDETCLREMRTGRCLMDKDHRGRCSTVVFCCDDCGKTRRGQPHVEVENPWDGVIEAQICFMCELDHAGRSPWA